MARSLRVEFPEACCHVINRGNVRFPVVEGLAHQYGCSAEELLRRHSKNNEARQVLLYFAATTADARTV